ncbi:MAG TPA: DUF4105 domain-containing protein [Bdellovibrionales bacterium]|nr:DUF4105 domain-containing protein [Bdellovibrionales bacterium]
MAAPVAPSTPSSPDTLIQSARALRLWEKPEWIRLVHYKRGSFGGWTSEADGANFFVAKDGRTNPQAELEATLAGFFDDRKRQLAKGIVAQSVRCQFPARYEWLQHVLGFQERPASCPEYETFRTKTAAKSVTLVFSSYYVAKPSSAFGHSLLRINKSNGADGSEHHQLLDSGVNYAAIPTTSNPVLYSIYGLSGMFDGVFTAVPYFYKVREYGDFESRDLWEYDLALTDDEVKRLIAHLWELSTTHFDYFYLTENCSYHMLTLLDAAAPRLNLADGVPYWVIPADTLKAVFASGIVSATHFRPSIHTQFHARLAQLDSHQEHSLRELIEGKPIAEWTSEDSNSVSKAQVLDTYMDYIDLHNAHELLGKESSIVALKQDLLLRRSQLPTTEPLKIITPIDKDPSRSHGSARAMGSFVRNDKHGDAIQIVQRFALHDLLDPQEGLPENAEIEMFSFGFRYWTDEKALRLENFAFFGVEALQPLDFYSRKLSWRVWLGADRVQDPRCDQCLAGMFKGGFGGTAHLFGLDRSIIYLLAEGESSASPEFTDARLVSLFGPTLGLKLQLGKYLGLLSEAKYRRSINPPIFDDRILSSRLRLNLPSVPKPNPTFFDPFAWSFELGLEHGRFAREFTLSAAHYY